MLLTKLNDGLSIGNFEYVFEHSEIRFKTSLNATHMDMELQICDAPFYYNLLSMDQYYPLLAECVEATSSAD